MKVLYFLFTIAFSVSPVKPQGKWSSWGSWSKCSRTCGGGISYQERKCLEGNCEGKKKAYRSCNIQDCPNGNGDFRSEQCAAYNSVPFGESKTLYEWVPYSDKQCMKVSNTCQQSSYLFEAPWALIKSLTCREWALTREWALIRGARDNQCALNCMPKNNFFYETFEEKVVDGTRCRDNTYDMCVDGSCKKAGCDLILDSDAKEDKCRVCNGEGRNCQTIQNIYKAASKGRGYVDILIIPAGATNIHIVENTRNFIALKNSSSSYILNGNRKIARPYKYKGVGTTFEYKRKGIRKERIFALGPTTEKLYLALLSQGANVLISYEYSVPKSQKVLEHSIKYSWKSDPFNECSRKCNGGEKTRKVFCIRSHDNVEVDQELCDFTQKPKERSECNKDPCPPRWFVGGWSPCSKTCGEGTQVRRIHCERETLNGIEMVDENLCSQPKTFNKRSCVILEECPKWKLGKWSACSRSCGGGIRTRTVQCIEINNNAIGDEKCPEHNRPRDQDTCNNIPCKVVWVTGDWGECRPSCGKGMKTRPVYCASSTERKRRYPDNICSPKEKPDNMMPCSNPQKCPPMWYSSMWSKCTARCGKGIKMRTVFCGVKEKSDALKILPNNTCLGLPELSKVELCSVKPCHTQWIALSWKPCSSTCGNGKRSREVKCYADDDEDKTAKSCDPKRKPPTEDFCNLVDCPTVNPPSTRPRTVGTTRRETTSSTQPASLPSLRNPFAPAIATMNPSPSPTTITSPTQGTTATRTILATRPSRRRRPTRPTIRLETTQRSRTTVKTAPLTTKGPLSRRLFPTRDDDNGIEGKSMPAVIIRGPSSGDIVAGRDITMPCEAKGNPKPEIFWLKGNLDVSVFGQRYQVLPNGHLKIVDVQEVDEDVYTCVASNVISRRSQPAYLSVTTKPYVDITLGYTVKQGKQARIECKASGKPQPTVQWYKDGQRLNIQDTERMLVTYKQILIKRTRLDDHGKYKCEATNKNGVQSGQMMLDVLPDHNTRMRHLKDGPCYDNESFADCSAVAQLEDYCQKPYYQRICCETCRRQNKEKGILEGI